MQANRRAFFSRITSLAAGLWAGKGAAQQSMEHVHMQPQPAPAAKPPSPPMHIPAGDIARGSIPAVTLDIPDLPFTLDNGVKVFHLVSEPVKQQVIPGRVFDLWGFNGTAPGPTIQINQGDRVRIVFENRLPEPTGIHWHGLEVPNEMDGVPGVGQPPVMPGEKYIYEFTLHQEGTFFYHSHMAMQE